jgi:lactoylglutathione lyase
LVVSDLNKTLRFYCDGLGLEKRKHMPDTGRGSEIWFLGAGSSTLEIFYYADPVKRDRPAGGRLDHTAWYVDDIRATMARLAVDGATFRPIDPAVMADGGLMAFTTGPDGERVELTQKP